MSKERCIRGIYLRETDWHGMKNEGWRCLSTDNMMKAIRFSLVVVLVMFTLVSCRSTEVVYFTDLERGCTQQIMTQYSTTIHPGDQLYIYVNSMTLEGTIPFNWETHDLLARSGATHIKANNVLSGASQVGDDHDVNRYLVTTEGDIMFPILGRMSVVGITRDSLARRLEQLLIEGGYITDPVVTVSLMNFRVAVIGEVSRPRELQITGNRLTILEAMAMCGDITIYGLKNCVVVIREVDGQTIVGQIDLTSKEMFDSPYYYLQSNDIIYVEPNDRRKKDAYRNKDFNRYSGMFRKVYRLFRRLDTRFEIVD